ncbi:MAG: M16 family metallopeptidase [Alphaproteobacteria bacterium]
MNGFFSVAAPLLRRAAIVIVLSLSAAAAASEPAPKGVFNPATFTLPNGMQVVVVENHRAPIVTHMVWYKVGSADEPPGKSGIAHFLEHLMFKGTKSLGPGEFSKIVANNGGRENAFTSHDYTGYFQSVTVDRLETVMQIEADRMTNLVLTDDQVKPERDVILEERRTRVDNSPRSILYEQARAALFVNHPYGKPIIGWEHEMRGLTTDDAIAFYRAHYAPNNAILIVVGDVTLDQVRPLAEKYYGGIASKPIPPRLRPQEPPQVAARRVEYRDRRVTQPSINRSYLAPSYNRGETQHAYALQVLSNLLGNGSTSRLYKDLVIDRKLASSAGAGYDATNYDLGTFYIYGVPAGGVDVAQVEAALDAALAKLLREGVSADEVDMAKRQLKDAAIFARDSLNGPAQTIGAALTSGRSLADIEAWPEQIDKVTPEQVTAAARHVLNLRRSVTALLLPPYAASPAKDQPKPQPTAD